MQARPATDVEPQVVGHGLFMTIITAHRSKEPIAVELRIDVLGASKTFVVEARDMDIFAEAWTRERQTISPDAHKE